jgi:hypothetical protein
VQQLTAAGRCIWQIAQQLQQQEKEEVEAAVASEPTQHHWLLVLSWRLTATKH